MTAFVNPGYVTEHPGLVRVADVAQALGEVSHDLSANARHVADREIFSARGLGAALWTAVVAAIVLIANQAMDAWTDSHLMAGWMVLWLIVFAASALLASPMRRLARSLHGHYKAWREAAAERAAEREMMRLAEYDPRVMADIRAAMSRQEA